MHKTLFHFSIPSHAKVIVTLALSHKSRDTLTCTYALNHNPQDNKPSALARESEHKKAYAQQQQPVLGPREKYALFWETERTTVYLATINLSLLKE